MELFFGFLVSVMAITFGIEYFLSDPDELEVRRRRAGAVLLEVGVTVEAGAEGNGDSDRIGGEPYAGSGHCWGRHYAAQHLPPFRTRAVAKDRPFLDDADQRSEQVLCN